MKNKFYGWLGALFFLVLLNPSGLLAEGPAASGNNAPKTAEELLVCIRDFLANPNVDGVGYIERLTGVSKTDWGPANKQTGFAQDPNVRWVGYVASKFKQPLSVPYSFSFLKLEEHTHALLDIDFAFFRPRETAYGDYDYLLELTPELTQKILGAPDKLYVTSPRRGGTSVGHYSVYYTYIRGRYELWIPFQAKGDNDRQLEEERMEHRTEQIQQEIARRKLFENHKNFLATTMRLSRKR